ncbi:DUF6531 domain-containing protein [Streptomyces sp. NPDC014864]|uniref:RHS repeat-associated core domain-containing protein n=1 Tax=Streptomyces sp. NPDC014864 TaxID=3364924 RepID=UPI0036F7F0B9
MVDLNPLHYVNKFNHMFGDTVASGLEFLGISDPAVDPDGVREIAKKWRHLAGGLDGAAAAAEKSLAGVEWEGKAAKAFAKRSKAARKQATDMAHALRKGAKALDDFADKAHEMLSEIGVLLAEIAEFEIAGLALDVLTLGASSVASSLMAGERALKVVALIGRIEEEGTALGAVVRGVLEVIRNVERALKALREVRGVRAVGKMAAEGAKFSAFTTALEDPGAFKDPDKLAGILTEGALMGVGFGVLGKALGKGLKALGPAALAKLGKSLGLDCAAFERLKLRPGFDKLPASIRNALKKFVRDPIDVATGDMALTRTDVTLPGVLPLVLERVHVSSYRCGGWFGPSWASTLDQRVQADEEGFVYAAADGARLCFPVPDTETGEGVRPETAGSRLLLSWDDETDGALRITDPDTGLIHVFHSPVAAAGDMAVDLPLQHIQDRNGNRITIEYDRGDIPARVVHSGGYRIALDHDASASRITGLRLLDPDAPEGPGITLLTFGYDEAGRLTEETNSSGLPLRYTYDTDGRITSWTDRNDTTYWYAYDDRGRVTATGGTGGALASTLSYEDTTRTTRVTDSLGHTRVYEHNEALRLVRETDPLGNVVTQEWDAEHRLTAITDPLGHTTRLAYGDNGRVATVTRPDGHEATTEYDQSGHAVQMTLPGGAVWRKQYDERGNRTAVVEPTGGVTQCSYDERGRLVAVSDALGNTTRIRPNAAGLALEVVDALGAVSRYDRDAFGRVVASRDATGAATRMEWTVEGRPRRRATPDGAVETWAYDGEGNCTSHTDPLGAVTSFEYTNFDRVAARIGSDGVRHDFVYDSELRLVRVRNPAGRTWDYEYDAVGNLASETDFDGRTRRYTHDAAGRLLTRTNSCGQTVRYGRNLLGQMVSKDVVGEVTTFEYAPAGRLVGAAGPHGSLILELDQLGRRLSETFNGRTLNWTYDALGRRTRRTTPSGVSSTWRYDAGGRAVELLASGRSIDFERDGAGREVARHFTDGITFTHAFDAAGRLTGQSVVTDAGVIQDRAFTYRLDGALSEITDQLSGSRRFDLDAVGRVTAVQASSWTESYAYDEMGNQTFADWPATHPGHEATGQRTYADGRLVRAGGVRYEYDAAGRIVLRQKTRLSRKPDTWRYVWDAEDRLTAVITPDGTRWQYLYDPLGRRIAKQRLAADGDRILEETLFTWDGHTLCEQITEAETVRQSVAITWHHDGHRPLAQTERIIAANAPQDEIDQRFFAIVTDIIGTPTELVGENGEIAWRTRTTLWGTTAWNADATAYTPLRFPGQYFDPETGLHYNYFRTYDPETARYLTPDPLGLAPAPNPVTYVDNPHTWIDPLGLAPGCGDPVGRTFDEAKAQALRDAGIPEGVEPLEVNSHVKATTPEWQGSKQLMTEDHRPIFYTEEIYEHPNGEDLIVFQDHWFGHQKPGEPGYQGPHVHVRPFEDPRNGQVPGCEEHYYYDL